ncbi:hypothetical protein HELRODRAFT_174637 [Helobdella robusta]|uniref:Uncharacterized protein n=1 Tax=Helobdella robusta TaxID=6412 RepID=T1F8B9_HELRO|nr:hypothetical protein HELRODRAFT_174637 [Helobdella robusta]ESO01675.1 hypothetical protein HELRODRAFT_174637 [Helobdella robusta]
MDTVLLPVTHMVRAQGLWSLVCLTECFIQNILEMNLASEMKQLSIFSLMTSIVGYVVECVASDVTISGRNIMRTFGRTFHEDCTMAGALWRVWRQCLRGKGHIFNCPEFHNFRLASKPNSNRVHSALVE